MFHGISKIIHGVGWMSGPLAGLGLPGWVAYGAYLGEVVAPLFLIIGLWNRVAALVVVVNMIFAIVMEAWKLFPTIKPTGGWGPELEAFYLLCAVAIFFLGGGRYAVSRAKGALA